MVKVLVVDYEYFLLPFHDSMVNLFHTFKKLFQMACCVFLCVCFFFFKNREKKAKTTKR